MIYIIKKILRKNQYGEYKIVEYHNCKLEENLTYYTDDIDDLNGTYNAVIAQYEQIDNFIVLGGCINKYSETTILMKEGKA